MDLMLRDENPSEPDDTRSLPVPVTATLTDLVNNLPGEHFTIEWLLGRLDRGLCPVILRNGTVYGYSPRMRYDLVVNTFVKDALLTGKLLLHGGGWMWRPLVDVRDVADAMIGSGFARNYDAKQRQGWC